jgi:hypothetical protein
MVLLSMTLQTFGILIFVSIVLYVMGKQYSIATLNIFGGFLLFLCGVMMLLNPILNITETANIVLGAVLFGVGAFMWVTDTLGVIDPKNKNDDED